MSLIKNILLGTGLVLLVFAGGCATSHHSWMSGTYSEEGLASWYGQEYAGRKTACGEIFDPDKMTAAHKTLPFQTWVRVHNLDNGKQTEVRINDRGPFIKGRIIDLSRKAAENLNMKNKGVARVRIETVR
jgi:rare lipoprotein A